jgi:hypothetical protein
MSFPYTIYLDANTVLQQSSDKKHTLGARGQTPDGRVFRYARAGEALSAGRVVMCPDQCYAEFTTSFPVSTDVTRGGGTITSTFDRITLNTTWATSTASRNLGSTQINMMYCTTGFYKDQFADGVLFLAAGTNVGQAVRLKGNDWPRTLDGVKSSSSTASTGTCLTLYFKDNDRLTGNITTSDEVTFAFSPYDRVGMEMGFGATLAGHIVTTDSGTATYPIGVTPRAVDLGYYFWAQTWGLAPVLQGSVCIPGQTVTFSTDAATTGAVGRGSTGSTGADLAHTLQRPILGKCVQAPAALEYALIDLQIAP